jgi:hypothetical protein
MLCLSTYLAFNGPDVIFLWKIIHYMLDSEYELGYCQAIMGVFFFLCNVIVFYVSHYMYIKFKNFANNGLWMLMKYIF